MNVNNDTIKTIVVFFAISGFVMYVFHVQFKEQKLPKKIGGTDINGCRSSAGYMWCDMKKKCIRYWEESC